MILNIEKVTSDTERILGDEVVRFEDVLGAENRMACRVEAEVRRIGDAVHVHADVTGRFSTKCHRCLDATSVEVVSGFDLLIQRGDEPAESSDEYVYLPTGQDTISLDHYIYENLIVNIPIQIFCKETCKGLCSGCGANLNREECTCTEPADPRWNELRKLRNMIPKT